MKNAKVPCFEMELAAVFTLASIYGLRAGAIFTAIANRVRDEMQVRGEKEVSRTAVEAVRILIQWDKEAKKRKPPTGFRSNFSCPSMVLL